MVAPKGEEEGAVERPPKPEVPAADPKPEVEEGAAPKGELCCAGAEEPNAD